jgi:hypothetical protein
VYDSILSLQTILPQAPRHLLRSGANDTRVLSNLGSTVQDADRRGVVRLPVAEERPQSTTGVAIVEGRYSLTHQFVWMQEGRACTVHGVGLTLGRAVSMLCPVG